MVGLALQSDLDGVEGIFDVFSGNACDLFPDPVRLFASYLPNVLGLCCTYRSIDDVFSSFHGGRPNFFLKRHFGLDCYRSSHIKGGLGHSGNNSASREERCKTESFLSSPLSARLSVLALPPLLWERGLKAGLKEYGEQAEAGGAAENCESAGALTATRMRSRDSGAGTRMLKSFKLGAARLLRVGSKR